MFNNYVKLPEGSWDYLRRLYKKNGMGRLRCGQQTVTDWPGSRGFSSCLDRPKHHMGSISQYMWVKAILMITMVYKNVWWSCKNDMAIIFHSAESCGHGHGDDFPIKTHGFQGSGGSGEQGSIYPDTRAGLIPPDLIWLVVVLTIMKNMSSSMGRMISHIWNGP